MNIREYGQQFSVYIFCKNLDKGTSIKSALSHAKYDTYYLENEELFFDRVKQSAPHIVVFDSDSFSGSLSQFVEKIIGINNEIKLILIAGLDHFESIIGYNDFGLEFVESNDSKFLDQRVLWSVDKVCEKLLLTYQNEQLIDRLDGAESEVSNISEKSETIKAQSLLNISISDRIRKYKTCESKEALIQALYDQLPEIKMIYFKLLPTVSSFIVTSASGYDINKAKGGGFQLDVDEVKSLMEQLSVGLVPPKAVKLMSNLFGVEEIKSLPLYAANELEGMFIYSPSSKMSKSGQAQKMINEEYSLFSVLYNNFYLEKKVNELEIYDVASGLFNKTYFDDSLASEVARAKRNRVPISLIKMSIDHFEELKQSLGDTNLSALLKGIAQKITSTSRTNDLTCRTHMNEISLILPHCDSKGAVLRAERVRRSIETESFLENGIRVSLSVGVSEYPTLCDSDYTLNETAAKSLRHISEKGGNKICLYKAPQNFKPDFEVSRT